MDLSSLTNAGIPVAPNALLSDYTTFKLGGPCTALVTCADRARLTTAVYALRKRNIPFILMGFGSNILASDKGINGVIIRYTSDIPLITHNGNTLTVDAATQLDALAQYAVNSGLDGMTTFCGIPGTVGGAIAGNAGAYGAQISDSLQKLDLLGPDGNITSVPRDCIHFEYRDSDIKHNDAIILSAQFKLPSGDIGKMQELRIHIIKERESKHGRWQDNPCAGSFFRNIAPTSNAGQRQSAGGIIERTGGKDLRIGGAHPYPKHANIITRDNSASAQDVLDLTSKIQELVRSKTGIELIREVRLLGTFNGQGNADGFW